MIKTHQNSINTVIVRSIPLDIEMKHYFISKYTKMVKCNGPKFASDVFKTLKEVLLGYRADPHRIARRDGWLSKAPFRTNGWLIQLFTYMDTHPHYTLDFVKLYCGLQEPLVSVEESAEGFHSVLTDIDSRKPNMEPVPKFLLLWLDHLSASWRTLSVRYHAYRRNPTHPYYNFVSHHSWEEWNNYWRKWKYYFQKPLYVKPLSTFVEELTPIPQLYKDFDGSSSLQFKDDLDQFTDSFVAHLYGRQSEVPISQLQYIVEVLGPQLAFKSLSKAIARRSDVADKFYVGNVHHIPKSGTVGRRPIAVPNRFYQLGTAPYYSVLKDFVSRLPKDSTFDQTRFIGFSQHRIDTNNYVGSVDLSKATDNLPLSWFEAIIPHINIKWNGQELSRDLFMSVAKGTWRNGGHFSKWTVGQPLGTLPSFPILAITHNLFLEALSLKEGYGHSPYSVLGDDILITKKRLRESYIEQMTGRNIPLSLHKSYEHHLVEFAGMVLIKNQKPRYISDHKAITFNNLFDYQRATGVEIPFRHLPRDVRRKLSLVFKPAGLKSANLYQVLQELEGIRDTLSPLGESVGALYFKYLEDISEDSEPEYFSGTVFDGETVITYQVDKVQRKEDLVPEWYKRKFRPAPTDKQALALVHAVRDFKLKEVV